METYRTTKNGFQRYTIVSSVHGQTGHSIEKVGNDWVVFNIDGEEVERASTKARAFKNWIMWRD